MSITALGAKPLREKLDFIHHSAFIVRSEPLSHWTHLWRQSATIEVFSWPIHHSVKPKLSLFHFMIDLPSLNNAHFATNITFLLDAGPPLHWHLGCHGNRLVGRST